MDPWTQTFASYGLHSSGATKNKQIGLTECDMFTEETIQFQRYTDLSSAEDAEIGLYRHKSKDLRLYIIYHTFKCQITITVIQLSYLLLYMPICMGLYFIL